MKYFKFFFRCKTNILISLLFSLLYIISNIVFAYVFQELIDAVISLSFDDLNTKIIKTIIVIFALCICSYLYKIYYNKFLKKSLIEFKKIVFSNIMKKSYISFNEYGEGEYINELNSNINELQYKFYQSGFFLIFDILMLSGGIIGIIFYSFKMGIVIILMALINLIIPFFYKKEIEKCTNEYLKENAVFTNFIKNIFSGFSTIRDYNILSPIENKYEKVNIDLENKRYIWNKKKTISTTLTGLLNYLTVSIPWFIGAYFVIHGEFSLGVLMGISQLNNVVASPMNDFFAQLNDFHAGKKILDDIQYVSNHNNKEHSSICLNEFHTIKLDRVKLTLNGKNIINDFSFNFIQNQKYIIIGESGCGKSTIFKLLMKYYNDYSGKIYFDKTDMKSLDNNFYNLMHLLAQDTFLLEDTLENNISLYKSFTCSEINEVLSKVGLIDFVNSLPNGIKTIIENDGEKFSGGEKQRISIARALLHKVPVLLVDEACSSLNPTMNFQIDEILLKLENITVIEISHHVNKKLLPLYDSILWIKEGKLHLCGKYSDMLLNRDFCDYLQINM